MATPRQSGRVMVQVVYVAGGGAFERDMLVPVGQTVGWCVNASGLPALHAEVKDAKLGIWGRVVGPEVQVADGDRVEVYRPCVPEAVLKARQRKTGGIAKGNDLGDNGE